MERRQERRHRVRARVLYFSKGQPRGVDANCENVSASGLSIRTSRPGPEEETTVSLILTFDGSDQEFMMDGVVRWRRDRGDTGFELGIEFLGMEPSVRDQLVAKLASHPEVPE